MLLTKSPTEQILCDITIHVTPIIVFNLLLTLTCSQLASVMNNEISFAIWATGASCMESFIIKSPSKPINTSWINNAIYSAALIFSRWFFFRMILFPINGLVVFGTFTLLKWEVLPLSIRWTPVASVIPIALTGIMLRLSSVDAIRRRLIQQENIMIEHRMPEAKNAKDVKQIKQQLLGDLFDYSVNITS